MKVLTLLTILLLQILTVASLPIASTVERDVALPTHTRFDFRKLIARALPNLLPSRANANNNNNNNNGANTKAAAAGTKGAAATGAGAKGAGGSATQQKAVMNAASSFANDVATVSSSLNTREYPRPPRYYKTSRKGSMTDETHS